jgi:hypothetical protein
MDHLKSADEPQALAEDELYRRDRPMPAIVDSIVVSRALFVDLQED